jgi:hypothetical protein
LSEMRFSNNYRDLSVEHGVNAGFQFEFYCEVCGDAFRTEFVPYKGGRASGWVNRTAGMLGGTLGRLSTAIEGVAESGFGKARDTAFAAAIERARSNFRRCARCHQYVCHRCFNADAGLCVTCAPVAEVEIEAARAAGAVYGAGEKAALEGIRRGKQMDVKQARQLVCPNCEAETKGAKFCPECGAKLAVKAFCTECGAEVGSGVKFCPECGTKQPTG